MAILTLISALLGAIVGFAAGGFGAASVLESVFGAKDGGPAMSGFFGFGPIGGLAGALLGAGLALRFGKRSLKWGSGLMICGAIVAASGGLLLAVASSRDRGPSYSEVIEFELEYPSATLAGIEIPSSNAMWGAAGADSDDHPISQFFEKKCAGDFCLLDGSVAALGPTKNFRIAASIGQKKYRYPIDLPTLVTGPLDWSTWRSGDGARIRWRIVKR
jgi:MFS family permease